MNVPDDTRRVHWNDVYRTKPSDRVSWYRDHLDTSLELLVSTGLDTHSRVLDVGGGASTLVDDLLAQGIAGVTVLDLSAAALEVAKQRLGARADGVEWRVGDITRIDLPAQHYSHWHDRAVLHFLTDPADASAYAAQAAKAVKSGGWAVIGGFAPDGPERCSGLTVARRSAEDIAALLGSAFEFIEARSERHRTPADSEQAFAWARLRRV